MQRLLFSLLMSCLLISCGKKGGENEDTPEQRTCSASNQCNSGETCQNGVCAPANLCDADSCAAGQFCDATFQCVSIAQKCAEAPGGCECHIANTAGQFQAKGTPAIITAAGRKLPITLTLAVKNGEPLPGAKFTLSVNSPSFTVNGQSIESTATKGEATLTAQVETGETCTAQLQNLGAGPNGNKVRFFVFDEQTGKAISGAKIIIDTNNDGSHDDSATTTTTAEGTFDTGNALTSKYTVTVVKDGYNYLSVAGLVGQNSNFIFLPIAPNSNVPDKQLTGGFSGKVNLKPYEAYFGAEILKAGLVASSFPLQSALNFDPALFLGPSASCEPATKYNCYAFSLGEIKADLPLPGGTVISYEQTQKTTFDTVGIPGRRFAWALGFEIAPSKLLTAVGQFLPYLQACACDKTDNVCDEKCSCDTACGLNLDVSAVLDGFVPLFPRIGVGYTGNLPLASVEMAEWKQYISKEYSQRVTDERFPILDSGKGPYKPLEIFDRLNQFTNLSVPNLPRDEDLSGDAKLDSFLALTGVESKGFGFIPLGLGVGLDCTHGQCFDRAKNPNGFDGRVNGGQMSTEKINDPKYIPNTVDGNIGFFHTQARAGLIGQPYRTLLLAAPVASLVESRNDTSIAFRAKGVLLNQQIKNETGSKIKGDSAQLSQQTFINYPAKISSVSSRQYNVAKVDGASVQWVTLVSTDPNNSKRWSIYYVGDENKFTAPSGVANDPIATSKVSVTHMAFGLKQNASLVQLLTQENGQTLGDLITNVERFSVRSGEASVQ